ncbi:14574_t:CDS:2 [Acaulospora morrowiae]|uniref:14574_t:CDS:1 n=1 Tax=Acaulospora morrowiae TaxID=94023 RepID=A0A9N8WL06_9GLOM|nr:14574_t:CDS:2 [Acaulospora morrowiae]
MTLKKRNESETTPGSEATRMQRSHLPLIRHWPKEGCGMAQRSNYSQNSGLKEYTRKWWKKNHIMQFPDEYGENYVSIQYTANICIYDICFVKSKRPCEIESATQLIKCSHVESSTNIYSRIQMVLKQPGVVTPKKLKNSKLTAAWSLELVTIYPLMQFVGIDIVKTFPFEIKPTNLEFLKLVGENWYM